MTENPRPIRGDDDAEGHGWSHGADAEGTEAHDDTEAHMVKPAGADAETAEGDDDVVGHVQPPRDLGR